MGLVEGLAQLPAAMQLGIKLRRHSSRRVMGYILAFLQLLAPCRAWMAQAVRWLMVAGFLRLAVVLE